MSCIPFITTYVHVVPMERVWKDNSNLSVKPFFFAQSDSRNFWKSENIAMYGDIALSVYKIDYTLRCFEYIYSACEDTDTCNLTITYQILSTYMVFEIRQEM